MLSSDMVGFGQCLDYLFEIATKILMAGMSTVLPS